ncbi:hypothetical protein [Cecembia calidifontis]|uniref:hypothetical protein n=1 Tax=Cecembia calidifontis TaxID=1187080 RepID=UPI001029C0D3|nr:hypothetical protein [Cecembia calidifontis]
MLQALILFCQIMLWVSIFSLIAGLYKPVLVLWYLDRMNRWKVIKMYGGLGLFWLVIWALLTFL